MKEHLQPWYDKWLDEHKETDLLYVNRDHNGRVQLRQVHFVRDTLAGIFWSDVPYDQRNPALPRDCKETAYVIGEHRSKSVRLPVYSLERPDLGLQIVLRDNYHDWNVSVISETPVTADLQGFQLDYRNEEERAQFSNGHTPGRYWGYCYFQGFPKDVQFGPFNENPCRFSLCIRSDYDVYTFLWLLLRDQRRKTHA